MISYNLNLYWFSRKARQEHSELQSGSWRSQHIRQTVITRPPAPLNRKTEEQGPKFYVIQLKAKLHSGLPCINFVFEIVILKKGSKPKNFIKQTIYQWFQVPAPTFSHFGPLLTFSLIFYQFLPYDFMEFNQPKAYEACICL